MLYFWKMKFETYFFIFWFPCLFFNHNVQALSSSGILYYNFLKGFVSVLLFFTFLQPCMFLWKRIKKVETLKGGFLGKTDEYEFYFWTDSVDYLFIYFFLVQFPVRSNVYFIVGTDSAFKAETIKVLTEIFEGIPLAKYRIAVSTTNGFFKGIADFKSKEWLLGDLRYTILFSHFYL